MGKAEADRSLARRGRAMSSASSWMHPGKPSHLWSSVMPAGGMAAGYAVVTCRGYMCNRPQKIVAKRDILHLNASMRGFPRCKKLSFKAGCTRYLHWVQSMHGGGGIVSLSALPVPQTCHAVCRQSIHTYMNWCGCMLTPTQTVALIHVCFVFTPCVCRPLTHKRIIENELEGFGAHIALIPIGACGVALC
jgi:hypothetical protein